MLLGACVHIHSDGLLDPSADPTVLVLVLGFCCLHWIFWRYLVTTERIHEGLQCACVKGVFKLMFVYSLRALIKYTETSGKISGK